MIRRNNFIQRMAEGSEDVQPQILPLVEITGNCRVLIEHHKGVVAYGCGEICVRVKYGCVRVVGEDLRLAKMSAEQLVICGSIGGVMLLKEES